MKLLFIQGGSRLKKDTEGNWYTDPNFNDKVWKRYKDLCDNLTVILRREEKVYDENYAKSKFNKIGIANFELIDLPDFYSPVSNCINRKIRAEIKMKIEKAVKECDKAIIRSVVNYYTVTALKCCIKYQKPYLIEVTGFAFEGTWYHSLKGKALAIPIELGVKRRLKKAPYAAYVTNKALQDRYPCSGETLGCSDVELESIDESILEQRLEKIDADKNKLIIGTAAFLSVKWKGQESVIKALARLKEMGIDNFEYQLIGAGDSSYLQSVAQKYGVQEQVKILGVKPHKEVFNWLDSIDIYIQPSYQEGLCRALVEAMSRACPIICSDVGGNKELASPQYLFKKGNVGEIVNILLSIKEKERQKKEAIRAFQKAHEYSKETLDAKRERFYNAFINKA